MDCVSFGTYGTHSADVHGGARCCAPSCTKPPYLADLRKECGSKIVLTWVAAADDDQWLFPPRLLGAMASSRTLFVMPGRKDH